MPDLVPKDIKAAQFATTCWSNVAQAGQRDSPAAMRALAELCQAYWYPLYAYLRRRGHSPHESEDLTQGFFADLLSRDSLKDVLPEKGKFRSFLIVSLKHFLSNRRDRENCLKRGGAIPHLSLDFQYAERSYVHESSYGESPHRLFERRWVLTLLDRVLDRLEGEVNHNKKKPLFERLKPILMGESDASSYAQVGAELGMTEGAVKAAAHRLRKRYRALLHEEIARTLTDHDDLEQEISELFLALSQ